MVNIINTNTQAHKPEYAQNNKMPLSPEQLTGQKSSTQSDSFKLTQTEKPKSYVVNGKTVTDVTDMFSQKEISEIFGRISKNKIYSLFMTTMLARKKEKTHTILISEDTITLKKNNETNNSIAIKKDGSIYSVGSEKVVELNPKGSFTDLFEEIQKKVKEKKANLKTT